MKSLYLLLNIGSISIPFLYSFHPKMNFKKHWKALFVSTTIVAILFIIWDYYFTKYGVWGFNESYHLGIDVFGMPLEEILFFFCIPYASIFIHYALEHFKPQWILDLVLTRTLTITLLVIALLLSIVFRDKAYTLMNYSLAALVLLFGWFMGLQLLRRFYIAFIIILIPFLIVNGVLTGSFIAEPVVWYNNEENMGLRLFTIPVEDFAYAFSMIFMNLLILNTIKHND